MKKLILSVAILATFLTACKKKKDDPTPTTTTTTTTTPKSKTEYLTAHSWKTAGSVSDVAIDADDNTKTPATKDLWSSYDSCEKDNYWTFLADGTGSFTDGGVVCAGSKVTTNFTWYYTNNSVIVVSIPGNGGSIGLTLMSIDDNTLVVQLPTNEDSHGVSYIETFTYTK